MSTEKPNLEDPLHVYYRTLAPTNHGSYGATLQGQCLVSVRGAVRRLAK